MYKVLINKMGPKSLTNLFSYKSEKTNYNLREISSGLSLPNPIGNNMKRPTITNNMKNSFMYDQGWIYWGGGGLFFMIKQNIIRDKMRYSNLSNNMMISKL
jgi:hypothetical protein